MNWLADKRMYSIESALRQSQLSSVYAPVSLNDQTRIRLSNSDAAVTPADSSATTTNSCAPPDVSPPRRFILGSALLDRRLFSFGRCCCVRHLLNDFHYSDKSQVIQGEPALSLACESLPKHVSGV